MRREGRLAVPEAGFKRVRDGAYSPVEFSPSNAGDVLPSLREPSAK